LSYYALTGKIVAESMRQAEECSYWYACGNAGNVSLWNYNEHCTVTRKCWYMRRERVNTMLQNIL